MINWKFCFWLFILDFGPFFNSLTRMTFDFCVCATQYLLYSCCHYTEYVYSKCTLCHVMSCIVCVDC